MSARSRFAAACLAIAAIVGCTAAQGKAVETTVVSDITAVGRCELAYVAAAAVPTPEGAVAACVGLVLQDAVQTFNWLESQPAGDAGAAALGAKVRAAKAKR